MLSLISKGIDPSAPLSDSITFMTSVNHLQSISNDTGSTVTDILSYLSSPRTHLQGCLLLKNALQQNPEFYVKAKWRKALDPIFKESLAVVVKEQVCEIMCLLLPYMTKDIAKSTDEIRNFCKETLPILLRNIADNVEWTGAALKCIRACLNVCPQTITPHAEYLVPVFLNLISCTVSSYIIEIVADCFSKLPHALRYIPTHKFEDEWKKQYLMIFHTQQQLIKNFLSCLSSDACTVTADANVYTFSDETEDKNMFHAYAQGARRYINLSKCLAKMLSTKCDIAVEVPVKETLLSIQHLFMIQAFKNVKPTSPEELQICFSYVSQMQIASLLVLESIVLNFNITQHLPAIADLIQLALRASKCTAMSGVILREIREAVWKCLKVYLKKHGTKVSEDFLLNQNNIIIPELLADITIEENNLPSVSQTTPKSKKNATNSERRITVNDLQQNICNTALEVLEQIVYTGSTNRSKKCLQDIFSTVLQITFSACLSHSSYPFPYNDELCRKNLYAVLLAFTVTSEPDQSELIHSAIGYLKNAFNDPSAEVNGIYNIAIAVLSSKMHPKRPSTKLAFVEKERRTKVSGAYIKCPEWISEDFERNLSEGNKDGTSEVHENTSQRITQTFHNPGVSAMHEEEDEEAMDEEEESEGHYPEHYATEHYVYTADYASERTGDNHRNGEDVLEIQHSGQSQDEGESEDEEDEEDERSCYEEEDIEQVEISPENIPSTSKLQIVNPVHISPETVAHNVADQEYEQLKPCVNTDSVDSNKNMHLNGEHSIVPDAEIPSSSSTQQSVANENGVYTFADEEEMDDEEEGDEEDEESPSFPAEKRLQGFYNPSAKRQKIESVDESNIETKDVEEGQRSPTLSEMKADFCFEIDDVKS